MINNITHRSICYIDLGQSRGRTKEGAGPQLVKAELDRFIELLFRDSEAYRLALKLYAGRYEVIACKAAADILHESIEKHMPDNDVEAVSEAENTNEQASE
jgi:hypothetical protein